MAVEGSLDLFSLPEILQMISQQSKTGILTIQGQQDIVAISFLAGRIVAADSLAHTIEEGLSKLLVGEGLLTAGELARAAAEHQAGGGRLLDVLVERRYLTREQLLGALRLQTIRQLEALLRWQEGDFKFYSGEEVSFEEGFDPISVEDLLLRNLADFAAHAPPGARTSGPAAVAGVAAGVAAAPAPASAAAPAAGRGAARGRATPESGELWLPQVPDLPDVVMPAVSGSGSAAVPAAVPSAAGAAAAVGAPGGAAGDAPGGAARNPAVSSRQAAPPSEPLPWPAAALTPPPVVESQPPAWPAAALTPPANAQPGGAAPLAGARPRPVSVAVPPADAIPPPSAVPPRPGAPIRLRPQRIRQMQVERSERRVPAADRLVAAVLAVGAVAALIAAARLVPAVLLPLPWEQGGRAALERNQRESLFDKIEGAAKTAFLRDGRFPDQLSQLRDSGLLAAADLDDPHGEPLLYSAREDSYTLQATESGKPLPEADATGSVTGNFYLDPSLLQSGSQSGPPIVLLD